MTSTQELKEGMDEMLMSLMEDVLDLIKIVGEENAEKVYASLVGARDDAVHAVQAMVGGMVLSPTNYLRVMKVSAKIAKISAKVAAANASLLTRLT